MGTSNRYRDSPTSNTDKLWFCPTPDPPADDVYDNGLAFTHTNNAFRVPPATSFPHDIGNSTDATELGEDIEDSFELVQAPYKDDPDSHHDEEPYAEDDIRYREPPSSSSSPLTKKSLAVGFLGFSAGIVVMVAFLLMTKGDRTGFRGVENGGTDDFVDGLSIDASPTGDNYGIQGESETREDSADDVGTMQTWALGNDQEEVASEQAIKEGNDGKESEEFVVTIKNQEPPISANEDQTQEPPVVTNEESNQAKGDQILAPPVVANEEKNQAKEDITASESNANYYDANAPVDLSKFCPTCQWKNSAFSCQQRVNYALQKFGVTEIEAQTTLMQQGHCPQKDRPPPEPEDLPDLYECRERPKPGENYFCVHCLWKNSNMSCWQRIHFLRSRYNTPEKEGMQAEMERGNCIDDTTDEEREKLKEQGLEFWCDACKFRAYTCWYRVSSGGQITDEAQMLPAKLDLMENGACKLPPYCDTPESTNTESNHTGSH